MNKGTLEYNSGQIRQYLEVAPSMIGPGPPPSEPMRHKHRGESRPPATERAMDFWGEPCNREAATLIEPLVSQMRRSWVSWGDVQFSSLIAELYSDPTTVARWERKETQEDYQRLAAFDKMCRLMADSIEASRPGRQINVVIPKRDQRVGNKMQARDQDRREKRDEEFSDLSSIVERVMERLGVGVSEAVGIVADKNGVSIRKVYDARAKTREAG